MEEDYVELEMDALNQHECMAAMIAVIKHMHRTKITPEVTAVSTPPAVCPTQVFRYRYSRGYCLLYFK